MVFLGTTMVVGISLLLSNPLASNSLVISGTKNQKIEVGGNDWQTKANASDLNKWCCLSIHWDVPAGANKSSCWVNGKKVKNFTSRTSQGSTQMTFGDLDPNGIAGLNGDIQLFLLYKGWGMSELIIKSSSQNDLRKIWSRSR